VLALAALRPAGPLTAGEIMAATGLSRPTVHAACDELIRLGWAVEREGLRPGEEARTGRPARRYEFHATAGFVVGVDMGVHTVRAVVADLRGAVVGADRRRVVAAGAAVDDVSADDRVGTIRAAVAAALRDAGVAPAAVLGAALGVPAAVDAFTGRVRGAEYHLPGLDAFDLRTAPWEPFGWTGQVGNDANLAALAERWRGAAADASDAVVLLAGERLGAGLVLGGALVQGSHGGAGELRFLDLVPGAAATGIGLWARVLAARAGAGRPDDLSVPSAAEVAATGGTSAEDVFAAARAGEGWARHVVDGVADRMALALTPLVTLLDPGLVVISGAVAASCDVLLPTLQSRLTAAVPWPVRVVASDLGPDVVVTGTVRLALDAVEAELAAADLWPR
jgi:predicted NBD/HSP70 family sugar kinase